MYVSANQKAVSLNLHRYNAVVDDAGAEDAHQMRRGGASVNSVAP
jgi:hypothetical protein